MSNSGAKRLMQLKKVVRIEKKNIPYMKSVTKCHLKSDSRWYTELVLGFKRLKKSVHRFAKIEQVKYITASSRYVLLKVTIS
jgi:hypothetical protein